MTLAGDGGRLDQHEEVTGSEIRPPKLPGRLGSEKESGRQSMVL